MSPMHQFGLRHKVARSARSFLDRAERTHAGLMEPNAEQPPVDPTPTPAHAHAYGHGDSVRPAAQSPEAVSAEWDARYTGNERLWSGAPNATLVTEIAGLPAGRVLDVGCGEGADAIWLAEQGWQVTALDVSQVALDRAAAQAADRGVAITWLHAGLVEAQLAADSFDLVTAQYPALPRTADNAAELALIRAVAPGGVLLIVHHPTPTAAEAAVHGFHPDDYVSPAGVAALLPDTWRLEVDETRPRHVATGAGSHHTEDVIVRARRLS